jgi:hypothetical protein
MMKCLLFFFLGIFTFVLLCFTSWWLMTALALWTLILYRLVQSTVNLKKQIEHIDNSPFIGRVEIDHTEASTV